MIVSFVKAFARWSGHTVMILQQPVSESGPSTRTMWLKARPSRFVAIPWLRAFLLDGPQKMSPVCTGAAPAVSDAGAAMDAALERSARRRASGDLAL
jgi:hypothetical protein